MRHAKFHFRAVLAALALALTGACATLKNDQTVCPEFRSLRCAAGQTCSQDKDRGCRVCRCDPMDALSPQSPPDVALPPPSR